MSNDMEAQLSAQGKILLAILRASIRSGIRISLELQRILDKHMGLSTEDWKIIADYLEADVAEMLATYRSGM